MPLQIRARRGLATGSQGKKQEGKHLHERAHETEMGAKAAEDVANIPYKYLYVIIFCAKMNTAGKRRHDFC